MTMRKTVGDLLREARTKKGLALQTIAKNTGISDHHLLAIELDQFSLIDETELDNYLRAYAEAVDLDFATIKAEQQNQVAMVAHRAENQIETSYDELVLKENPNYVPGSLGSRSSRRPSSRREEKSVLPLFLLSLLALGILLFVGFILFRELNKGGQPSLAKPSSSLVSSSQEKETATGSEASSTNQSTSEAASSENKSETKEETTPSSSTTPSSEEKQTQLTTSGGGESLEVKITDAKKPVVVDIAFEGETSWVGLSNSDLGEAGTYLNGEQKTYKATLNEDATEAVLSMGITQGISIKVNDQPLDMSAITSTSNSFIVFTIE